MLEVIVALAALIVLVIGLTLIVRVFSSRNETNREFVRALVERNAELEGRLEIATAGLMFRAIPTQAKYLKPGDLWSDIGPHYWETAERATEGVGQYLAVRGAAPVTKEAAHTKVYRIEIVEQT